METKQKPRPCVFALLPFILYLLFGISQYAKAQDDAEYGNNAFGYSFGATNRLHDSKTEKMIPNWSGSFWRCLGSKQERGGTMYFGVDFNSKVEFKHSDSLGTHYLSTSTLDFATGFTIQNKLSTQYSGRVVKLFCGFPTQNVSEYKFHFGGCVQFNFNMFDFQAPLLGEWNLVGIYVEAGVHGLVYHPEGLAQRVLWSPTIGVGINLQIPEKTE